jgi:hypothetical protein
MSIEGCFPNNQSGSIAVPYILTTADQSESSTSLYDQLQSSTVLFDQLQSSTTLPDMVESEPEYFYLYRISYAWYSFIGFMTTFIVGSLVSLVYTKMAGKSVLVEDKYLATFMRRNSEGGKLEVFRANGDCHDKECRL